MSAGHLRLRQGRTHILCAAGFFERLGVQRIERVGMFMFNSCTKSRADHSWIGTAEPRASSSRISVFRIFP